MSRHEKTRDAIFSEPTRADIRWNDAESLLIHLGAHREEGSGSRVRFELNGVRAVFHRPHPGKEMKKYAVEALRDFLTQAGC